ncbi:MAG: glycoside hydrolase [Treponema sp.]|jgi:spore germination protein YaaH|nr:glycoside hydrolase [Treponema sp.]
MKMKRTTLMICLAFPLFSFFTACSTGPKPAEKAVLDRPEDSPEGDGSFFELPARGEPLPVSSFPEIWGYLLAGREAAFSGNLPISDIGYFGAEIDMYGKLTDVPNRRNITNFSGRVHMVVACNSRSLAHFTLMEGSAERRALVADLLEAAKNFDGLQIDFELIPQRDAMVFLSFLAELRAGLGDKMFTVALPARVRSINNDIFDYRNIEPLVDRILVMAYDEHWSTSAPGPIASLPWCKSVAEYALEVIGREKLIMGIPFYGRAWGNVNPARAYLYSGIEAILNENNIAEIRRENGIPTFDYEVPVAVKVYYEDDYSLSVRMEMYKALGVGAVGFWRLGQETPAVWNILRLGTE